MKSIILALFAILALLLIANTSHARPGTGGYWHVMNGEAMPMIQDLIDTRINSADSGFSNMKSDTKVAVDIGDEELTIDESDPIPDITIYHGDSYLKGKNSYVHKSGPVPDATIYDDDSHLKEKNSCVDESAVPLPDVHG